jgi:hypothetical protein
MTLSASNLYAVAGSPIRILYDFVGSDAMSKPRQSFTGGFRSQF